MNRLRRRLSTTIAAISLLLCLSSAALWLRSFRWADDDYLYEHNYIAANQTKMTEISFDSNRGRWYFSFIKGQCQPDPSAAINRLTHRTFPPTRRTRINEEIFPHNFGFWLHSGPSDNGAVNGLFVTWSWGFSIGAPHWFVVLALGTYPAWLIFRRARTPTPTTSKCCPTCGYDLRAAPDRCPECGTPVKSQATGPPI